MIEKHYGKYIGGDDEEQLARLSGSKVVTPVVTPEDRKVVNEGQGLENSGKRVGGPTWIRTTTARETRVREKASNPA